MQLRAPRTRRRRTTLLTAALAALGTVLAVTTVAAPTAEAATSANLILNGGAETGQCSLGSWDATTVPGWKITAGDPVIDCYNSTNSANTSTPGSQGAAYFQGGSRGSSEMTQTVDVSSAASAIDAGSASSSLSGYLGGVGSYTDATTVTATYLNASGSSLGTSAIGPVTPSTRGNTTELFSQSATKAVPAGTRTIRVAVDFAMTGTQNDALADGLSLTLNTAVTAPTLAVPASTVPGYDHVFMVMMENNNYSATSNTVVGGPGIIGNSSAPYINDTLVPMGSLLTNYYAITHNSDPNYEAIAFGNAYGRSYNSNPAANCITNPACAATNPGLNDNLDTAGKSWKQYTQSQTSNCQTTSSGNYENDDVPFYYDPKMQSDNAYCQAHWQPLPQLLNTDLKSAATTPAFVWADADSCYDMEGCGISSGDTWLSQTLPAIFNSPAWTTQKSLLVLTFDEDGNNGSGGGFGPGQSNQVATIVIGSQGTVKAGYQDTNRYDHYSTARVIEGALGLPSMTGNDQWATPYNEVFTGSGTGGGNTVAVTNPGSQSATAGTAISPLQIQASGQSLTYSATGLPAGLTIGASTGQITGTPTTAGTDSVTVTAKDNTGATGTASFTWTVNASGGGSSPVVSGDAYHIVLQGGQVIDDPASSTTAGTQLIVYSPNSPATANQKWTFTQNSDGSYTITNAYSGLCMDDSGSSSSAGAKIIQWTCTGNANQHWSIVADGSSYELVSKQSGLPVTSSGTADSSTLTQQANTNGSLQLWSFSSAA